MTMMCLECDETVLYKRSDAKYCSVKCRNNYKQKAHYARNTERVKQQWRNYSDTVDGTATLLLNYAKDRAKKNNLAFDLDKDFILEKLKIGKCELTDLMLSKQLSEKRGRNPMTPSLDRKIPELGYTKENVRLVCFGMNAALGNWGEEMFSTLAKAYLNKSITK